MLMDEKYIAAIDLGTSKVKLAVAKVQGRDVQVVYYKDMPSAGVRRGVVINYNKALEPVKQLISDAEKDLGLKIMQAVVGFPRYYTRQILAEAVMERTDPSSSITKEEIEALKDLARDNGDLQTDGTPETVYGAVAQSFAVDGFCNMTEEDVEGMTSDKLEGNFKFYLGENRPVNNILAVMNNASVALSDIYFTPEVVAKAVLSQSQMDNGVALLELGGGVSSVSIYKGGVLRHYASIPFGGAAITADIKIESNISTELAENIKLGFGACQPDDLPAFGEKIIRIAYDDDATDRLLPVNYLSQIITARETEIVEALLYEIQNSGLADALRSGIVITGGAANMLNCANLIKEMSGYDVTFGFPRRCFNSEGCPEAREMDAATVIGLILAARDDSAQNCVDGVPANENPVTIEETPDPVAENPSDELFPEMQKTFKKPKKEKKKKVSGTFTFIDKFATTTHKILQKPGELFGDIYTSMDDNNDTVA